jgi:hypothetical protein
MKQRSIAPKEAVELALYLVTEALRAAGRPPGRQGASSAAEAARGMAAVCQEETKGLERAAPWPRAIRKLAWSWRVLQGGCGGAAL